MERYESLKIILDRLLRNSVLNGISYESVIDYTIDFIEIVGIPSVYNDKIYEAEIDNYRVSLPCDFIEDIQILLCNNKSNNFKTARQATDTFHEYMSCMNKKNIIHSDYTYSINRNFIFTSLEAGRLKMAYRAILTDDEGYPMLPSSRVFQEALEWYIKYKYYTILWEEGRLEDKRLDNTKQEYAWAVGRLETDMRKLSLSKAESFFNSFRTLIPRDNEFSKRFANNGIKEILRAH